MKNLFKSVDESVIVYYSEQQIGETDTDFIDCATNILKSEDYWKI